jgi:carbonic anhydrase/acetyltransferase-like protein (isoleucine patch superfamily)
LNIDRTAFIHESAVVLGAVTLGARSSVWPTAVIRADSDQIEIGDDSNVQDGAIIHCDPGIPCTIGNRVTIGHRAMVHGARIEDDCLIGIGAIVLNKAVIGAGSLVGAGAVVTENTIVPPGSLVLGAPAKVVKPISEEQRARMANGYRAYVELQQQHRNGDFPRRT